MKSGTLSYDFVVGIILGIIEFACLFAFSAFLQVVDVALGTSPGTLGEVIAYATPLPPFLIPLIVTYYVAYRKDKKRIAILALAAYVIIVLYGAGFQIK